jgi:hypothetical protein
MSVDHMKWVLKHSRSERGTRLVAMALAFAVHRDNGDECWPKLDCIAKYARLSPRQVTRCVNELVALGEIEKRRYRDGNHYRFLLPDATPATPDAGGRQSLTSAADDDLTLMADPRVYREVIKGKEREHENAEALFAAWQELFNKPDALFSPARKRVAQRALAEEPDVAVLIQAMRGFKTYRLRKSGSVELGQIFGTYKGTSDLRTRIEWLCSLAEVKGNAKRSVEEMSAEAHVEPAKVYRRLEEMRYTLSLPHHPERERAERARLWLISQGFNVVRVPAPMLVDITR